MQRKKGRSEKLWGDLELEQELSQSIEAEWHGARQTFWVADILLYISIVFSIAATAVVGSNWLPRRYAALITAVAAVAVGLERAAKFGARSDWHNKYFLGLFAIRRKMRDEGMSAAEASRRLTLLDIEMDRTFPERNFLAASPPPGGSTPPGSNPPSDAAPQGAVSP